MLVRSAQRSDVDGIREVSLATGQPDQESGADADYVNFLLATGAVVVAVDRAETVIGWGATKPTPCGILLSDLFVTPTQHGQGVGSNLLKALLPGGPADTSFTFSSQHDAALPLYARAGLVPSWPLLYLTGEPTRVPSGALSAERVDATAAARADAALTSAAVRSADYEHWTSRQSGVGLVIRNGDVVVAAGAGKPGELPHLTCADPSQASAALFAALAALACDQVSFCLPGPHPALRPLLQAGFRINDYDIAMSTPDVDLPPGWIYSPGLG